MQTQIKVDVELFTKVYRSIYASRELDLLEQDYVQRGEAFFHVSGSGHENIAFLNPHLKPGDFLHCHYRDKSLLLERGMTPKDFFLGLFSKDQSSSRGRQMCAHLSDPKLNVMSMVGPVGNSALQAVGAASMIKDRPDHPIVYLGIGDGTTQEGEMLEAVAQAVRDSLPVLFVIQDNSYAISVKTQGQTFFSHPDGEATEFYGIPIERIDGKDPIASYYEFERIVERMREDRKPALVVFKVERLNNHTNADDQRVYRSPEEIEEVRRTSDPVVILEHLLLEHGATKAELEAIKVAERARVLREAEEAQESPEPIPSFDAKAPLPEYLTDPAQEYRGSPDADPNAQLVMLEAIREVLKYRLGKDKRVTLYGEDIEDPKGDVFGVTKGLSQAYPGRVRNSPLTESTIVGFSVGQAMAGGHPVAFLQFADFFPIAFNQIWAEMGSMFWRSDGNWKAPVILMVSCGGFRPGLGPFHGSSMESFAAHVPGIDVFLPSTAGDAAGLLNAAFESERPTIFFYPKSCLNDRSAATSRDVSRQLVPIGKARFVRRGANITMVGWGNTIGILNKAAKALEENGVTCDLIDLRSISPWDQEAVLESVRKTGRLIIAQEDNHTVSMASEISATVAEHAGIKVDIRRITRPDTWIPFNYPNQMEIFPSYRRILQSAVEMLGGSISWTKTESAEAGTFIVDAIGSSPSDESVTIIEWKVKPGDTITKGMVLAEAEADKAVFEINSPAEGTLETILVEPGDMVKVGSPLLKIKTAVGKVSRKLVTSEDPGVPTIRLPSKGIAAVGSAVAHIAASTAQAITNVAARAFGKTSVAAVAGIAGVAVKPGSRIVSNEEISKLCPDWKPEDIFKRIGISNRHWVAPGETALSLAVDAARSLLSDQKLAISDIDLIMVATGTPQEITPSMACLILAELSKGFEEPPLIQAVDLNAACSGFLYGLQTAHDFLLAQPDARILLITTEVLSPSVDKKDPATAPIFGDAATASLVVGAARKEQMKMAIERPVLGAWGESGALLKLPRNPRDSIYMDGPKVFLAAVKNMIVFLERACAQVGMKPNELDLVIPHQANQRIINAVRQKAQLSVEKVYSAIADFGNTSSSSIPLCIDRLWKDLKSASGKTWGLVAFGGGFTFGGAVLRVL